MLERDYRRPMFLRGGIDHLAWKGAAASSVEVAAYIEESDSVFEWTVRLVALDHGFAVKEQMFQTRNGSAPMPLLEASAGKGWWWSGALGATVPLSLSQTSCALAAAVADASFPAHGVAQFIARWRLFDASDFSPCRVLNSITTRRVDDHRRNVAETLYRLDADVRQRILEATRAIIGLPDEIEPRLAEDGGRVCFVQQEHGLQHRVHEMGVSSGTLRVLALMTALHTSTEAKLIGIEEPENNVHPSALSSLIEHLAGLGENTQLVITSHSPLVLDALDDSNVVRIARRDTERGTVVESEDAGGIRKALDASGFRLGEYYQTRGFGT